MNGNYYIGSTVNSRVRFSTHRRHLRKNDHGNAHLQRAWNLYGESAFQFYVQRECPKSSLLMEEQRDLDEFFEPGRCYNISLSAMRPNAGIPRTEEVKRKISIAQKGKPRFTDEQRRHLSAIHMGKTHTHETRVKMMGRPSSRINIGRAHITNVGRVS